MNKIITGIIILTTLLIVGQKAYVESREALGATPKLQVFQGGTGAASFTAGECLVGAGTSAITTQACGAGGADFAWTVGTNYSEEVVSTSTPIWLQDSLYASSTAFIQGELTLEAGLASTSLDDVFVRASEWVDHDDYPSGCSGGEYVSAVGDSLVCSAPAGSTDLGNQGQIPYYATNATTTLTATSTISLGEDESVTIGTGNEMVRITDYKMGIGTSTPYARLTVWATTTATELLQVVNTASSSLFTIYNSGTVRIGGLDCSGNANGGAVTADANGDLSCTDDDNTTYSNLSEFGNDSGYMTTAYATSTYVSNVNYYATSTQLFAFCLASTSPEFVSGGVVPLPMQIEAYEITDYVCYTDGATSVQMTPSDGSNDMDTLTCDANGDEDDGSIANSSATAKEAMQVKIGTITDTPDYACMTIFGNLEK